MHTAINNILKQAGTEANFTAEREPPTHELLLNIFSPTEAMVCFPKKPTREDREFADQIRLWISEATSHGLEIKNPRVASLLKHFIKEATGRELTGRRIDLLLTSPMGEEIWIDGSTTHTTAISYLNQTYQWLISTLMSEFNTDPTPARLAGRQDIQTPSPTVMKRITEKYLTYQPLMIIAEKQASQGMRSTPQFRACIISRRGEFSPDVFSLINRLADVIQTNHKNSKPTDRSHPKKVAAAFRGRIKDHLACAIAKGVGRMITETGHPVSTHFKKKGNRFSPSVVQR
jgi:hypothetical protein